MLLSYQSVSAVIPFLFIATSAYKSLPRSLSKNILKQVYLASPDDMKPSLVKF